MYGKFLINVIKNNQEITIKQIVRHKLPKIKKYFKFRRQQCDFHSSIYIINNLMTFNHLKQGNTRILA